MKEIRTKVCKKANAYIKSGMNRSAAFKRAWSETYVKAANLQNGDKIMVTTYSNLWREMVTAPAKLLAFAILWDCRPWRGKSFPCVHLLR